MRLYNANVFDEVVAGTSATWYSAASFHDQIGTADTLALHAFVSNVTGTSPTLTVQAEHSADGQNWTSVGTPEISTAIVNNTAYYGADLGLAPVLLSFVRLKITLGGTSPQCRLKIAVTGRTY